jgi:hypothetical protein
MAQAKGFFLKHETGLEGITGIDIQLYFLAHVTRYEYDFLNVSAFKHVQNVAEDRLSRDTHQ